MTSEKDPTKEEALIEMVRCLKETYSDYVRYLACKEELENQGYIVVENGISKVRVLKEVG